MQSEKTGLYLPFSTIVKVLAVLVFVGAMKILASLVLTLFLALLIAVSLNPVARWLEKKGVRRGFAIALIALLLAASIVGTGVLVLPKFFDEGSNFISNLPKVTEEMLGKISPENPLRTTIEKAIQKKAANPAPSDITPIFSIGNIALGGVTEVLLIFVFAIYLLADGGSALTWFIAFFSAENQKKIKQTSEEISPIIFSYVAGQFITSFLSFIYVLIVMAILHVPSSLLLASLAAIFDVLPVLGFFLAVIPAMLFAMSVSGSTVVIVLALYIVYHGVENYFIVPAVYGKRLRVSGFVVLLTLIAAGLLAGIEGAVAVLPLVASYPIIERIWLKKWVGSATIADHESHK